MHRIYKFNVMAGFVAIVMVCLITANSLACCFECREKAAGHIHKCDELSVKDCPNCAKKGEPCSLHKIRESGCANCKKCLDEPLVTTKGLEVLMMSNVKMVVLDARHADSYAKTHIPGAVNIPPKSPENEIRKAVKKKDLIVVYCGGLKCPMSHRLAMRLHDLGFHNVIEYPYGIECWVAAGNTVEGSEAGYIKQSGDE